MWESVYASVTPVDSGMEFRITLGPPDTRYKVQSRFILAHEELEGYPPSYRVVLDGMVRKLEQEMAVVNKYGLKDS